MTKIITTSHNYLTSIVKPHLSKDFLCSQVCRTVVSGKHLWIVSSNKYGIVKYWKKRPHTLWLVGLSTWSTLISWSLQKLGLSVWNPRSNERQESWKVEEELQVTEVAAKKTESGSRCSEVKALLSEKESTEIEDG